MMVIGKKSGIPQERRDYPQRTRPARGIAAGTWKKGRAQAVLEEITFTGRIVGVRRDAERTARRRRTSARAQEMEWNVEDQHRELWDQFTTDFEKGTPIRIILAALDGLNIGEYNRAREASR